MRTKRTRNDAPQPTAGAQPQHDTGDSAPALPNERDEHIDVDVKVKPEPAQAARDLASGQMDTDNYTRTLAANRANPSGARKR